MFARQFCFIEYVSCHGHVCFSDTHEQIRINRVLMTHPQKIAVPRVQIASALLQTGNLVKDFCCFACSLYQIVCRFRLLAIDCFDMFEL